MASTHSGDAHQKDLGTAPEIIRMQGSVSVTSGVSARASVIVNFSAKHLLTAAKLAREVGSIEDANKSADFGSFFEEVIGGSVSCVVLVSASLEAYANELFANRNKYFTEHDRTVLDMLWEQYERKPPIDKFDLALRIRKGQPLDRGDKTVQGVCRVVDLRNALVHFKPESLDEQAEHEKLSKRLEGHVSRSPWFPDEPLFPRAWATHETTAWAVSTVLQFVRDFSAISGIEDRLCKFRDRLPTDAESSS